MESLLGIDSVALRPVLVAPRSQPPRRAAAIATLEAVYRRGDITREDYVELSRRVRGG